MKRTFLVLLAAVCSVLSYGARPIVSWGSSDMRYAPDTKFESKVSRNLALKGWKGETVYAQAVISAAEDIAELSYELTDFRGPSGTSFCSDNALTGFTGLVLADGHTPDGVHHECGSAEDRKPVYDSTLVADYVDPCVKSISMDAGQTRTIWISCRIPSDAVTGEHVAYLNILSSGKKIAALKLVIDVGADVLPEPEDWKFHLDLWQNPYAVARISNVKPWSDEHLEAMRPTMTRLARAGQKVITTSITYRPWNAQTEDAYDSMVAWIRNIDGEWEFRYDVFDKWVQFMMDCGITGQISCFSTVSWSEKFQYFDLSDNTVKYIDMIPGTDQYNELWGHMLRSFARHLKEKGWFDICTIAMDERPLEIMQKTISMIRGVDKDFKISLAGNYHPEIDRELHDYCIIINTDFPSEALARRQKEGKVSTLYTCCTPKYPNSFLCSDLAESTWIGYYLAAKGVDGFLRWAYNSWPVNPMEDARFTSHAAGDVFMVYPGDRTSLRFEKLIEGIQAYEKIRILRSRYAENGDTAALDALNAGLEAFVLESFGVDSGDAQSALDKMRELL